MRSRARAAAEAATWDDYSAVLDQDIEEIEIGISIAEAQLALDSADDGAAFEAAVGRQIGAHEAYAELLDAGIRGEDPRDREAIIDSIRARAATALECLQRYRDLSNEVSDSLRAGVLAALDDLDRAATQAGPITDG